MSRRKEVLKKTYRKPGVSTGVEFLTNCAKAHNTEVYTQEAGRYEDGMEFVLVKIIYNPNNV